MALRRNLKNVYLDSYLMAARDDSESTVINASTARYRRPWNFVFLSRRPRRDACNVQSGVNKRDPRRARLRAEVGDDCITQRENAFLRVPSRHARRACVYASRNRVLRVFRHRRSPYGRCRGRSCFSQSRRSTSSASRTSSTSSNSATLRRRKKVKYSNLYR